MPNIEIISHTQYNNTNKDNESTVYIVLYDNEIMSTHNNENEAKQVAEKMRLQNLFN